MGRLGPAGSRPPVQTDPFFFRYSREEECTAALNQIPSYLLLEVEREPRGQLVHWEAHRLG